MPIHHRPPIRPRVAFQGEVGAFSHEALVRRWRGRAEPVPMRDNRQVAQAVASGIVDRGLLPLENSIAGGVHDTFDALADVSRARVVGEMLLPVRLCLAAPPGATLGGLAMVESHP